LSPLPSSGAAQLLRARRFSLALLPAPLLAALLARVGLRRAPLPSSGGGPASLLLPPPASARPSVAPFARAA
ncbi:hypothetical protein, partial [Mycobacterium tuberculosis]|uniref:hypothetical protein n=1 Tax=Mycobacterium tuberculosis TaxID=1773 RepID=UPI0015F29EA6